MSYRIEAISALVPDANFSARNGKISIWDSDKEQPTEEEINEKIKELQAEYKAKQYQRDRAVAYDPIPEQLDQIYHDIDGWKAKIKAVKDKFPKP